MVSDRPAVSVERIRGHWIGLVFGCVAAGWFLISRAVDGGIRSAFHATPLALALIYGFLAYWFWRAIDYTGWRFMSRYLPRR
jgi:hypothetical protein